MPKLICLEGPDKGMEFPLQEGLNDVGRSNVMQVQLTDRNCSRVHCRLEKERVGFTLEDANSRNGTFVNDKAVMHKQLLKPGDIIMLGATRLEFSLDEAWEQPPRPRPDDEASLTTTVVAVGGFLRRLLGKH